MDELSEVLCIAHFSRRTFMKRTVLSKRKYDIRLTDTLWRLGSKRGTQPFGSGNNSSQR